MGSRNQASSDSQLLAVNVSKYSIASADFEINLGHEG